ncbi:MAG: hypothetical protein FJY66_02975, partial [Calditrichaeota bacterium]|nr:hypothetical protein [Calditrichota bacterium]
MGEEFRVSAHRIATGRMRLSHNRTPPPCPPASRGERKQWIPTCVGMTFPPTHGGMKGGRSREKARGVGLALSLLFCTVCFAQEMPFQTSRPDTLPPDTLMALEADTLRPDTLAPAPPKDEVDTLVLYSADSIDFDVTNRVTKLIGNATVRYKDMELRAAVITVDWNAQLLMAG